MVTLINKKDIIGINQDIGESGKFQNESSLEYSLSTIKHKKSWLYETSYIIRSLLVDYTFTDGNKRTALAIITTYFEDNGIEYNKDEIIKIIWEISKKSITDINKISRMIKNAVIS